MKIGRNDPCPCGSGKKYKKCCLPKERAAGRPQPRASQPFDSPLTGGLPEGVPLLVDASTGDPVSLITDHWEVRDWEALAAVLEERPDVGGNREQGWARLEEDDEDEELRRTLLAINPGRGNRLETFARTHRRADEGREWFSRLAGDLVEHKSRETADPWSGAGAEALLSSDKPSGGPGGGAPVGRELMQLIYHKIYRNWADEPLPALRGKTPRQAIESPQGREKVIELLKLYEDGEREKAEEEDREPASLQFLWDALGLAREEALGG